MTNRPEPLLWLDDHRGRYIPRDFARSFADRASVVSGVTDDDWVILEAGPDGETFYWDVWVEVCDSAIVTIDGTQYRVYQDGDCWLIPDGMEWSEDTDTFAWPGDDSGDC
jgi:hypothetical protein